MTKQKTILIVEDDDLIRKALQQKLVSEGMIVLEALDGEEGLAISLKQNIDLILLDLYMPRMDGITMLKKLREDQKGKDIPVIIITNYSSHEKKREAELYNANLFLLKTQWKLDELIEKINQYLKVS